MNKKEVKADTILINRNFAGGYLSSDPNNVGHEFINLYKTDNGENYLYIAPHGTIGENWNKKIETILFVKPAGGNNIYEIVAKAEGLEQLLSCGDILKQKNKCKNQEKLRKINQRLEEINKEQREEIKNNDIKYGGAELDSIYNKNADNDPRYFTFKSQRVYKPTEPSYIVFPLDKKGKNKKDKDNVNDEKYEYKYYKKDDGANYFHISEQRGQDLRIYISKSKKYKSNSKSCNCYEKFKADCVDKAELWEELTDKVENIKMNTSFIEIIRKEYDELAYSNLLQYLFSSDKERFSKFAADVLNIKNLNVNCQIEREYHIITETQDSEGKSHKNEGYIDLLVTDESNVIVIENKIKSGIHGKKHDISSKENTDQLTKYYNYITAEEEYKTKNKKFFIFLPDYNKKISVETLNRLKEDNMEWEPVYYSQIYDFYKDYDGVPYFADCVKSLKRHTEKNNNILEKEQSKRLYRAIEREKTSSIVTL